MIRVLQLSDFHIHHQCLYSMNPSTSLRMVCIHSVPTAQLYYSWLYFDVELCRVVCAMLFVFTYGMHIVLEIAMTFPLKPCLLLDAWTWESGMVGNKLCFVIPTIPSCFSINCSLAHCLHILPFVLLYGLRQLSFTFSLDIVCTPLIGWLFYWICDLKYVHSVHCKLRMTSVLYEY